MFVTFRGGGALVERSKVISASSPEAELAVRRVLRGTYVDDGTPSVDPETGAIIEGVIRKLKRGTDEFDRAALSTLPDAFVVD